MEQAKGLKRRDFLKTTAVGIGITIAGLDLLPSGALAQEQKAQEKKKDVAWAQEKARQHYFVERFNCAEATSLSLIVLAMPFAFFLSLSFFCVSSAQSPTSSCMRCHTDDAALKPLVKERVEAAYG